MGSIGHPHPLQGVVPTLHKVQGDLVGTEEGPWSLGAPWEPGSRSLPPGMELLSCPVTPLPPLSPGAALTLSMWTPRPRAPELGLSPWGGPEPLSWA